MNTLDVSLDHKTLYNRLMMLKLLLEDHHRENQRSKIIKEIKYIEQKINYMEFSNNSDFPNL